MAIPVGLAIVAPFSGRLRRRWGTRMLTSLAGAVLCVATLGAAVAPNGKVVAALLVLVGFAIGIVNTTTNAVVMSAVELKDRGLASGTVNLARAAGSALGMALATSVVVILQNSAAISLRPVVAILAAAAGGVAGVAFWKIPRDQ